MGRLLHAAPCSRILATLLLLAFAGNLHADDLDPNAKRNPPPSCDPETGCTECPPTESSVDNGCVQVTLALGRTSPLSDQRRVELKIFTASASPALSTPETLHVVMGYTFQHLGPVTTPGAAPSTVDFVRDNGGRIRFRFAAGSSLAIPDPGVHIDLPERVQMVDANGWATLTEPVYYDLYPGDGSVWRFLATDITGELGKLVSYTDPRGRVLAPEDFGVDIVRAPNGLLRQVLAPSRLADIVTRGPAGYTVTVYPLSDADAPAVFNGLYVPPAHAPTEVLTVDRGDDIDRLVVTLKKGGADALRYDYAFVNGEWTLVRPDGVVDQKEIYYSDDEQTAQMVKTVKDASGAVQRRTVDAFSFESWGYTKTNQVDGFGSAVRSTSWTHVMSGPAKGRIAERRDSTGAVVQYAYDANARRVSETRPALGEVVTVSYAPVDPADPALLNDTRPRTVIRKIDNIEVERTYYAYTTNRQEIVERAATQGAAYGTPDNLRTVTTWYPADLDDHAAGRLKSVRHEDGQLDLYTYSWVDSVWTETVTRVHEDEPDPVPMQTTRRSTVHGRAGHRLAERTELLTAPGVWEPIDGVAYEYDVNGRETKRTAFNGLTTTSAWSGTCCGKSSETAPDGTRTTFTYDTAGRLVVRTVLDPAPIETHIAYDALGRRVATWTTNRVAQLGTPVLRTTYDPLGRVVSQTEDFPLPLGEGQGEGASPHTTTYAYSANERTTTVTQPTGATQITVTDTAGRIVALSGTAVAPRFYTYGVNADGTQWTKVYHGTDATAPAWSKTTHDLLGRTIREEKPGFGNTLLATTYTYDNGGRVLSRTQSAIDNSVPSVLSVDLNTYDRYGDLLFSALDVNQNGVIDFNGPDRVTGYTTAYIAKDNALWQEATQSVHPDFDSDRAVVTAKSRRKLTNLGAFASVSESEDIRGNVTTATQAVNPSTGYTFATTIVPTSVQPQVQIQRYGLLVESVSTTAVTNRYAYDALNRRVSVIDGRGNTSTTTYNTLGQTAFSEDAATNRTSYVYDDYGRQIEVIDALNQSTYTAYDLRGNVIRQYGATYPVWYEYDAEGRMTAMATTRDTTLDPATVDSLDHPSLDVTRWNYDPATGLLTQKLYDDGKGPSYTYTPDGKLATRTWARGIVTSYAYDVLGSVLSVNYSDATPDVTYTYDRIGRQLSAIAAGVNTNLYAYSTNTLELIAEVQNGVVINRSRDAFGRASGIALESDYDVGYGYDTFGRFAQVSNFQFQVSYSYLSGSSLVSGMTASTGHAWMRSYEPQRNLITAVTNSFNGNLISAFDYANDAIGRRTARLDSQPAGVAITNAFGYNARSEVTSAAMGTNAYGYVFDPIGNRIVSTNNADVTSYAANELNQYTNILCASTPLREPSHDDDGNMLTNGVWSYVWDGENRLIGISSNDLLLATHAYDHQSRRVGKFSHEDAKTRSYVYDGWNLIQEFQSSTIPPFHSSTNSYVWGLDLSGTSQGSGGVGGLLAVVHNGIAYYPTFDGNGNVTEYIIADGTVAAHYEYDAFGRTIAQFGDLADSFLFRFSTKYWEDEDEGWLYNYGYRFYSPGLGRWLNRDPIGENGSIGLVSFCNNRQVNSTDMLGMIPDWYRRFKCKGCPDVSCEGSYNKDEHFDVWGRLTIVIVLAGPALNGLPGEGADSQIPLPSFGSWLSWPPDNEDEVLSALKNGARIRCRAYIYCMSKCECACNGEACYNWQKRGEGENYEGWLSYYKLAGKPYCSVHKWNLKGKAAECYNEANRLSSSYQ